jgi:hypothetical protein
MKKTLLFIMPLALLISCESSKEKKEETSASAAKPNYAYTIEKPDNWDIGSTKNTEISLAALKAFENNKIDECLQYFADTVRWRTDYLEGKFTKDSLRSQFTGAWNQMASLKISMHDFESVISKDKKDEYVTLWYVQTMTDKKGKVDSMAVINDIKISNGKIVALDEAYRHFPVKK